MKADIGKDRLDVEWHVPGSIQQSKEDREDACMKFYNSFRHLYLETDASTVGLQVRDGISCGCNELPDNAVLEPIILSAKTY